MTDTSNYKKLCSIIAIHDNMRGCYTWIAPQSYMAKLSFEASHSQTLEIKAEGNTIKVSQNTVCTKYRIYYKMRIYVNGELTNFTVAYLRKLLREEEAKIQAA